MFLDANKTCAHLGDVFGMTQPPNSLCMFFFCWLVDESEADNAKWVWVKNSKTAFPFVGQRHLGVGIQKNNSYCRLGAIHDMLK